MVLQIRGYDLIRTTTGAVLIQATKMQSGLYLNPIKSAPSFHLMWPLPSYDHRPVHASPPVPTPQTLPGANRQWGHSGLRRYTEQISAWQKSPSQLKKKTISFIRVSTQGWN